jgi:hypothetical protein
MVITVHVVKCRQHSVHIRCLSRRDGVWDRLPTLKWHISMLQSQRWTWQRSTASKVQIGALWTACYIERHALAIGKPRSSTSHSIHRQLSTTKCTASRIPHPYVVWSWNLHHWSSVLYLSKWYLFQRTVLTVFERRFMQWRYHLINHRPPVHVQLSTLRIVRIHQLSTSEMIFALFDCVGNKPHFYHRIPLVQGRSKRFWSGQAMK